MTFFTHWLTYLRTTCPVVLLLSTLAVHAQNWPDKPIKLLAPSTPGGPPDVYARALADNLSKALGQPVVVENMPAAGGMIAAKTLLRAPSDGHTLMVSTAGMLTITPSANAKANYQGTDFTPICQGVEASLVLASHPSLAAKNMQELLVAVKNSGNAPSYSSYSAGSPAHFLGYQLSDAWKIDMTHIPYKSSPQQITDMLGGVAPLGFVQIATARPHIKAGKLLAYATTSPQRDVQLPDVPTTAELGLPQLTTTVWFGLTGPKNLPPAVTKRLTQAHLTMTASAEFSARMMAAGLNTTPDMCGEKFSAKISQDSQRWARVVKATGFTAED